MVLMLDEDYIFKEDNQFVIKRELNGKVINFGSFDSLEEAINYRDELEFDGWPIPREENDSPNVEDNIEKINDSEYIVFRIIKGKKDVYGPYDSLTSARKAKYNLKATGWESDLDYAGSKYGKYISKMSNKFVVRRIISGKYVEFGSFDNLEDARNHRDELILDNWGEYNIKPSRGYGKYIAKVGKKYRVQKAIKGKPVVFGVYETLEEATLARDKFESENWENIPDRPKIDSHRYIYKTPRGYVIYKRIDGDVTYFGSFRTFEEALEERDKLIQNNWQLKKDESDYTYYGKNIQFDGNYFTVEKFVYRDLRVYGVFKNKEAALKLKNRLQLDSWMAPYRLKTREYPYGENIVPFDYLFNVEIQQNGELKEFGPFHSFEEAVKKCEEIENQNEKIERENLFKNEFNLSDNLNDKERIFLEIYNQVELIPEPNIPFPQADIFEIFVEICKGIYSNESLTRDEIMGIFQINPRQYSFYISAGEYLGLIERSRNTTKTLSELGLEVFSGDSEEIKLSLIYLILIHKPFYDVFGLYLRNREIPTKDEIFEVLKNNEIYNVDSEVTLKRRATSVRSWIKWIISQY